MIDKILIILILYNLLFERNMSSFELPELTDEFLKELYNSINPNLSLPNYAEMEDVFEPFTLRKRRKIQIIHTVITTPCGFSPKRPPPSVFSHLAGPNFDFV